MHPSTHTHKSILQTWKEAKAGENTIIYFFYSLPETCTNTQELLLPYRNFSKPNYLFQATRRNNSHWSTHMAKHTQRGWVAPVTTGLTDCPSTPHTRTPGEILDGTFNNTYLDSKCNTQTAKMQDGKTYNCIHLTCQGRGGNPKHIRMEASD